jgi:hypothetical protein
MEQTQSIRVDWKFYVLFVLVTIAIFPIHESAHFLAYRAFGVHLYMTLNTASPADQDQRLPMAEIAGPLLNLVLAAAATVLLRVSTKYRRLWATTALSASLMRLAIYLVIVVATLITGSGLAVGNDEPIAAHMWHLNSLTLVGLLSVPFLLVVWTVSRSLTGTPSQRARSHRRPYCDDVLCRRPDRQCDRSVALCRQVIWISAECNAMIRADRI